MLGVGVQQVNPMEAGTLGFQSSSSGLDDGTPHTFSNILGGLMVAVCLAMSLECSYLLLRAVRHQTF